MKLISLNLNYYPTLDDKIQDLIKEIYNEKMEKVIIIDSMTKASEYVRLNCIKSESVLKRGR